MPCLCVSQAFVALYNLLWFDVLTSTNCHLVELS